MLNIVIIGERPTIRTKLHGIVMNGFPGVDVRACDLALFKEQYGKTKGKPELLLIVIDPDIHPENFIENIVQIARPKHIVLYVEESFLADPALYFKDTLVKGIAHKHQQEELLLACLRVVSLGGFCFPPYDRRLAKHRIVHTEKERSAPHYSSRNFSQRINRAENKTTDYSCEASLLGLTERQYEVLVLLAQGWPLKTIAKKMKIAPATAKTHTEALYQRLGANNRSSAVFAAMEKGAKLGIRLEHSAAGERS